jgi:copper transport protein
VRRGAVALAAAVAALALPASAFAHAALLRTVPAASGQVDVPPREVALTYSEVVEPRFAIVSVTNADGVQQVDGGPRHSPTDATTLDVPVKKLAQGWYLVFWRVISADGHPVRGAFTFAVGPNPGPAPQFVIPSLSETAATPGLVIARFVVFLSLMAAVGLFVLRAFVARPLGSPPRALAVAFGASLGAALVAVPFYVLYATSRFALRSIADVGALVPLMRNSAFGRGLLELELLLALFGLAAAIVLVLDRPGRAQRSVAELLALLGALLAAGAVLLAPGAAGHAAQTSPRALALLLDWLHLAAGSIWVGGLIGLLVLWRSLPKLDRLAGLVVCVPRFSAVALGSVAVLLASGIWASVLHLPTLASLWETSYGQAILVKAGLLLAAIALGAANNRRTVPALRDGRDASGLLLRLVAGESALLVGAVAAAAVLTSLAPPPKALAGLKPAAHVGPGAFQRTLTTDGYRLALAVTPNRAAVPNEFTLRVERGDAPVRGADVTATFTMLDMEMPAQEYRLRETSPGVYAHSAPSLVMVGRWGLTFDIAPQKGPPVSVVVLDKAGG